MSICKRKDCTKLIDGWMAHLAFCSHDCHMHVFQRCINLVVEHDCKTGYLITVGYDLLTRASKSLKYDASNIYCMAAMKAADNSGLNLNTDRLAKYLQKSPLIVEYAGIDAYSITFQINLQAFK